MFHYLFRESGNESFVSGNFLGVHIQMQTRAEFDVRLESCWNFWQSSKCICNGARFWQAHEKIFWENTKYNLGCIACISRCTSNVSFFSCLARISRSFLAYPEQNTHCKISNLLVWCYFLLASLQVFLAKLQSCLAWCQNVCWPFVWHGAWTFVGHA